MKFWLLRLLFAIVIAIAVKVLLLFIGDIAGVDVTAQKSLTLLAVVIALTYLVLPVFRGKRTG